MDSLYNSEVKLVVNPNGLPHGPDVQAEIDRCKLLAIEKSNVAPKSIMTCTAHFPHRPTIHYTFFTQDCRTADLLANFFRRTLPCEKVLVALEVAYVIDDPTEYTRWL